MKQKLLSNIEISQICQELAILLYAGVLVGAILLSAMPPLMNIMTAIG